MTMFGKLVWLFAEHRDAVQRLASNELLLSQTTSAYEQQAATYRRSIDQLETQLQIAQARTAPPPDVFLKGLQDALFAEQPFPDGSIPENAWLTPGPSEPPTTHG